MIESIKKYLKEQLEFCREKYIFLTKQSPGEFHLINNAIEIKHWMTRLSTYEDILNIIEAKELLNKSLSSNGKDM